MYFTIHIEAKNLLPATEPFDYVVARLTQKAIWQVEMKQ